MKVKGWGKYTWKPPGREFVNIHLIRDIADIGYVSVCKLRVVDYHLISGTHDPGEVTCQNCKVIWEGENA